MFGAPMKSTYQLAGQNSQQNENDKQGSPQYQWGQPEPNLNVNLKIEAATVEASWCTPKLDFWMVSTAATPPSPQVSSIQLFRGGCFGNFLHIWQMHKPLVFIQAQWASNRVKYPLMVYYENETSNTNTGCGWNEGPTGCVKLEAHPFPGQPSHSSVPRKIVPAQNL